MLLGIEFVLICDVSLVIDKLDNVFDVLFFVVKCLVLKDVKCLGLIWY